MELFVVVGAFIVGIFVLKGFSNPPVQPPAPTRVRRSSPAGRRTPAARSVPARPVKKPSLPPFPKDMTLSGKAYVIDGDTIKIKGTKIRLAGIDAPELNMPWGQKSKWAMVDICKGQTITVDLDGERSFDRLVGTCFLPDGRDIGAELITRGLALDLPEFSRGKYRHLEPAGARKRLCNGRFGHASIKVVRRTRVRIESRVR